MNGDVQHQAEGIDRDVVLDAAYFLARIKADRVDARPPFSAARTL
jgi:hypothetical protein